MHVRRTRSLYSCSRGTSAVEFSLVAPIFLAILFWIIGFGFHLSLVHSVQQLAAEAARASVAGLDDGERASLARTSLLANAMSYPLISPMRLQVVSALTDPATSIFAVTVRYDASGVFIYNLPFIGVLTPTILRTASVKRGGY